MNCGSAAGRGRQASRGERGHTLVELAIVLAIIGIVAGLARPSLQRWKEGIDLRNGSARVSEALLLARTRSVVERREYTVSVDYAADAYAVAPATVPVQALGPVDIYLDNSDPDCPAFSSGNVVFRPNSTADAVGFEGVHLRSRNGRVATRYRVKVLGATGKVSVERLVGGQWVGPY